MRLMEFAGLEVHFVAHGGRGTVLSDLLHDQTGGQRIGAQPAVLLRHAQTP